MKRLIKLIPSKTSFKKGTNYQCQNESGITTMKEGMSLQVLQALKNKGIFGKLVTVNLIAYKEWTKSLKHRIYQNRYKNKIQYLNSSIPVK